MAQKRMFAMKIVDSDAFLDMPLSTQCLYFHLNMRADDDGFVGNPKKIMRMIGASDDDFKILLAKKFLLIFENNVIVIKHWWMNNTLRKDCYHETSYLDEKNQLKLKENKSYTLGSDGIPLKKCEQDVNGMLPEYEQDVNAELDKDKELELDEEQDKNNNSEKKQVKPEVVVKECWFNLYQKLFNEKPDSHIDSSKKHSFWSAITKQIQKRLELYDVDTLKSALQYGAMEKWIIDTGFSISAALSEANISASIQNKPHQKINNDTRTAGKIKNEIFEEKPEVIF